MAATELPGPSTTTCHNHGHSTNHLPELTLLTLEAALILLVNISFLVALYRRRRWINWKSSVFVANMAVSDLLCSFSLVAMGGTLLKDVPHEAEDTIQYANQLVTTYSMGMTVLNYNALYCVQYFSIRHPLIYRTRCTKMKFVYSLIGQWVAITAYVAMKAVLITQPHDQQNFSRAELTLMGFFMLYNTVTYGWVLYVSAQQTMRQLERRREKEKEPAEQQETPEWGFKALCRTLLRDYRNTVTAGLHLIVYVLTFSPMWIVRVYVAVVGCPDHLHCGDTAQVYACACAACRITFYIWYLRAILDPLLQVVREPQLRQEWLRWALIVCPCLKRWRKEGGDKKEREMTVAGGESSDKEGDKGDSAT